MLSFDGELLLEEARRTVVAYQGKVDFEYVVNLSLDELTTMLADLLADSAVLHLSLFRDSTGQSFSPGEIPAS